MKNTQSNLQAKEEAAIRSLNFVKNKMKIGLGTGSTTAIAIRKLAEKVKHENLDIQCCTTSFQSFLIAREHGLLVFPVQYFSELDLTIDGADEVDPQLNLIKGGGAAHTLEKIVHSMSNQFICIVDETKHVSRLGEKFPVPIEVIPEAIAIVQKQIEKLNPLDMQIRLAQKKDGPIITDKGNFVLDVYFNQFEPEELEIKLNSIPGVVENGIFAIYKPHILITGGKSEIKYRNS